MDILKYLFGLRGRIDRARMWLFVPIAIVWFFVINTITSVALPVDQFFEIAKRHGGHATILDFASEPGKLFPLLLVFALIGLLVFSWLAVMTKRLHDRNKSARWLVLFCLLPALQFGFSIYWVMGQIGMDVRPTSVPIRILIQLSTISSAILSTWGFVELYCLPGSQGENRFGASPIAATQEKSTET